jgi:hypothetical protein
MKPSKHNQSNNGTKQLVDSQQFIVIVSIAFSTFNKYVRRNRVTSQISLFLKAFIIVLSILTAKPEGANAQPAMNKNPSVTEVTDSPVQFFKSFVSNPPIIESLVYEIIPGPVDPSPARSASFVRKLYHVRVQSNAFYFRKLRDLSELENERTASPVHIAAGFDNEFWTYDFEQGLSIYVRRPDSREREEKNAVISVYKAMQDNASSVLNMGIPNQGISSIVWTGNAFSAKTSMGVPWRGQLVVGEDGVPVSLKLHNVFNRKTNFFDVRYEYGGDFPHPFLPSQITYSHLPTPEESIPSEKFLILRLRTNSIPLPRDLFDFKAYSFKNTNIYYYTNNQVVYFAAQERHTVRQPNSIMPGTPGARKRLLLWIVISVSCLIFAIALFRVRSKSNA